MSLDQITVHEEEMTFYNMHLSPWPNTTIAKHISDSPIHQFLCKPKVSNFNVTCVVKQDVLWLQVSATNMHMTGARTQSTQDTHRAHSKSFPTHEFPAITVWELIMLWAYL